MALSVGFINSNGGYRVFPSTATTGEMGVGGGYATLLAGGVDACPEIQWDPVQGDTTIQVEDVYKRQNQACHLACRKFRTNTAQYSL